MINKTKTKILTLSVISVVGLAAITVLASNANNALVNNPLEFQGEVKQNAHLELKELKLIENPTKPGVTSQTDVTWKMDDNELVATKEVKGTTNRVEGQWTLSIWGQENSITESESFILWGKNNTLNAKTSIIGASNSIKGEEGEGDTVLGSSDVTFTWSNNIVQSANGTNIKGSGNIVLSTNQVNITTNNTMAIGNKAIVSGQGSFVFNGTTESLKSTQEFTTLISGNNGMIINTNKRNTPNVGLTVNWGIKVGQITNLDQQWSLITQDNCLQLKSTEKGAISLKCRGIESDGGQVLETPKCWRNAANYHYTDSRWKGAENSDFCAQGTFEGDKSFRSEEQRTTPTGIWSYADRGFTYDFTICFRDKDPLCAPKNLSKTWRCKTDQGNAVVCEANLQIKPMQCGANQHLEDEGQTNGPTPQGRKCLPNQKTVSCDDKGINKANGSFTNEKVSVKRDAKTRTYETPSKCTLKCNEGFKLNEAKTACMSSTKQVSCDEISRLPSHATWKNPTVTATRNPQKNSWDTPKCDFECKTGYYYDNNDGEPKCLKIPFSCEPWDNVTNATLVSTQEGIVGRDNKRNTLIWNWENPTTTCQYKCKTEYNLVIDSNWVKSCKKPEDGVCSSRKDQCLRGSVTEGTQKQTDTHYTWECKWRYWGTPKQCTLSKSPQCTGNIPANASISQEQKTWFNGNKTITLVKTINPNQKCQAVCNSGFELKVNWNDRYCAEKKTKTYQCTGDVPKFSSLILNDDKDLKWDTRISLVERGWNTASKCEYQCNIWYFKVWNRCEKTCYATMARDGVSEKHYRNYKPFEYYVPHSFIAWNGYNPYALAAIKSDFFKILDLGNFPTENIGSSLYYKVPNRLKYANATKFTSLDRDSNKNTALFIKDTICSTEECDYLYVRPRDDMIEKGVTDLSSLYSEGHYTYVSVEEAKNGFFTSPWWNHRDRSGNLWSALCFFDQSVSSGGSCTSSVGYTWWPHALHAPYYCSDVYPKEEYGKCWGTVAHDGKTPCSAMTTKKKCDENKKRGNSMFYCQWKDK